MRALLSAATASVGVLLFVACSDFTGSTPTPVDDGGTIADAATTTESSVEATTCATDDQCNTAGPCQTSHCVAGRCETTASPDGTPIAAQVAGDCNRIVCNADGTTRTVADDTDVATAACATVACNAGAQVSTPTAAGTACTNGVCDGAGACVPGAGNACTKNEDCASGSCADGVCCNESCTGECKSCSLTGKKGICSLIPYYQEDPSYLPPGGATPYTCDVAIAGSRCDGKGQCKRVVSTACNASSQCMSGNCSNLKCLGAPGELCNALADCASNSCKMGSCE